MRPFRYFQDIIGDTERNERTNRRWSLFRSYQQEWGVLCDWPASKGKLQR